MRKPREDELNPDKVVVVVGTSSIWPRAPAPASISTRVVATPASSSPSVVHGASARVQRRPQDELEPQRWSIAPMPSSVSPSPLSTNLSTRGPSWDLECSMAS
uniref:Uncharacterized protein n=1 Tax=Aegilops tauschii subsp. strangulata TaxID=200361 RepID=A0A453HJN0_AEGTS